MRRLTKVEKFYLQQNLLTMAPEQLAKDLNVAAGDILKKVRAAQRALDKPKEAKAPQAEAPQVEPEAQEKTPPAKTWRDRMVDKERGVVMYTGQQSLIDDGDGITPGSAPKGGNNLNQGRYGNCVYIMPEARK